MTEAAAEAPPVTDNPARSRYELEVDGQIVFGNYRRQGDVLVLTHVEAPTRLRGTGAAGRFMEGLMQVVRAEGLKVVPRCGYAACWIQAHDRYRDLLA
jgi:predicted GNAT family acetyltransferase